MTELSSIVEVVAGIRRTIRYLPAIRQLPGSRNTHKVFELQFVDLFAEIIDYLMFGNSENKGLQIAEAIQLVTVVP